MADWTDGPEYAPEDRPAAFVAPDAVALAEAPSAAPVTDFPADEPNFVAPSAPAPDLRELVPTAAPGRNPNLPFESITSPMTAVQPVTPERRPEEPFNAPGPPLSGYLPVQPVIQPTAQVNPAPFPAPGSTAWFAPPTGQPVLPSPSPVDISRIWKETTNWVMIPLIIAMFILPASPIALLVAWLSTVQIRYRRTAIRRAYWIALAAIVVISLATVFADSSVGIWDPVCITSLLAAWVLVFVTPGLVGAALRNNEAPDRY
ncbi:MAG: hypothetical protein LWW77_01685 [Propionibacteriales bacterium]|nr:hypothetical protein [Propionibacteriales bacterium]